MRPQNSYEAFRQIDSAQKARQFGAAVRVARREARALNISRVKYGRKYFVVARKDGKRVAWRKWSKDFRLEQAVKVFRQSGNYSFNDKVRSFVMQGGKTREVTGGRRRRNVPFSVVYEFKVKGKVHYAASMQGLGSVRDADEDARENMYYRIADELGASYDADEGERLLSEGKARVVRRYVRYYVPV